MGGSKSKVLSEIVNQTSAEVIVKHMQNCQSNSSQSQSNISSGISLFNSQTQEANINLSCAGNFQMNSQIATEIANTIQQKAEAQSIAVFDMVAGSKSEATSKITNLVSASVTSEVVQRAVVSLAQSQQMGTTSGGIQIGNSQKQTANMVMKAIMDSVAQTNLSTTINNHTSQTAKSSQQNPLGFLTSWIKWIFIAIIVIIGGIVLYSISGSSSSASANVN